MCSIKTNAQKFFDEKTKVLPSNKKYQKSVCPSLTQADSLGRVVIPKEIRHTLRIKEGSPLEIYTEKDGGVTFRK